MNKPTSIGLLLIAIPRLRKRKVRLEKGGTLPRWEEKKQNERDLILESSSHEMKCLKK